MRSMYRIRIAHSEPDAVPHLRTRRLPHRILVAKSQPLAGESSGRRTNPAHLSPDLLARNTESRPYLDSTSTARNRATHADHSPLRPRRLRAAPLRSLRLQRQSLLRIRASRIQQRRRCSRARRTRPALDHRQARLASRPPSPASNTTSTSPKWSATSSPPPTPPKSATATSACSATRSSPSSKAAKISPIQLEIQAPAKWPVFSTLAPQVPRRNNDLHRASRRLLRARRLANHDGPQAPDHRNVVTD